MAVIKEGKLIGNDWQHIGDGDSIPEGNITVTLGRFKAERELLLQRNAPLGVRLGSSDDPADLAADLESLGLVVLEFPQFTDGRLFSTARLLRERYGYRRELRARGEYIRDQVFYLSRVGINAFEPNPGAEPDEIISALAEFTVRYQAASDIAKPLYRRRG